MNAAGEAACFHALSGVYRIAPHVIGKFVGADHASNKTAGMQADTQLERLADGAPSRLIELRVVSLPPTINSAR